MHESKMATRTKKATSSCVEKKLFFRVKFPPHRFQSKDPTFKIANGRNARTDTINTHRRDVNFVVVASEISILKRRFGEINQEAFLF